jgi:hypothetical protein
MFLSAVILARLNGHEFSQPFMERLEKMVEFVMYVTKPDGTAPLIGDNDNGRLHRLKVWDPPDREWTDFSYLLAIGAVLFEREDFAKAAGDQWEESIWLLGERAVRFKQAIEDEELNSPISNSHGFADAGVYVMRHKDYYMIVDAGPVGQGGNGGHAHNDVLSFELYAKGHSWIIDPGTYVYTADYEERKDYRSTAFHNTVMMNEVEINDLESRHPFSMSNHAHVTINQWITTAEYDYLDAEHTGYHHRLGQPVTHRRRIYFEKQQDLWKVEDILEGEGSHLVSWFFNLAPGIEVGDFSSGSFILTNRTTKDSVVIVLENEDRFFRRIERQYSFAYGRRTTTLAIELYGDVMLPAVFSFLFYPCTEASKSNCKVEAFQSFDALAPWVRFAS